MADGLVVGGGAGARSEPAPVLAYAGLVGCVGLWGIVFVAVAKLLRHIDAVQVVTVRFAVVAAVALISPLSWAGYTLLVAPLVARHPPAGIACCVYIAGTLMTLPALPHALGGLDRLDGEDWAWIIGLASVATVVPNLLWAI